MSRTCSTAAAVALLGAGALGAAGCGAGHGAALSSTAASVPQPVGVPVHGGTVVYAEAPGATPNYIFPLTSITDFDVANTSDLQELLYRPLYWFGSDGSPTVDLAKSIGRQPVFTDGDRTVTIALNHYTWSDGETVDARDVIFWMDLLKAEKANWADYAPGYFPDDVRSMAMPDGPTGDTVRFGLSAPVSPTWFLYNELSQITPLPVAWDRTSDAGPVPTATQAGLPDTTLAGARAVYAYLNDKAKDLSAYATSALWSVVDGPWRLSDFQTDGAATFVPNSAYTGPDKPYLAKFVEQPWTSDTAEFDAVKSGGKAIQVGYVPDQDMPELSSVESEGYRALEFHPYAFNYLQINFNSSAVGPLFAQLYVRQALQDVIDQPGWVKAYFSGLATPTYGPVPVEPPNPFADAFERSNPYPFSLASAAKLLAAHGWVVRKGGTTTCARPAACGSGIRKGEALKFTLDFASGSLPLSSSMEDFHSEAARVGIQVYLVQQTSDTVIGEAVPTSRTWEIANWGAGWIFGPDYYPSGEEIFATGVADNGGGYSSPVADKLVAATTTSGAAGSQGALDAYQDYIARQLPVLYQPAAASEMVVSKDLGGTVLEPNAFQNLDPESWYYVKAKG